MQYWDLLAVDAPDGTRDAVVVHQDDSARAVLVVLNAGQALGQHQVKENAWISVVDGTVQVAAGETTVELGRGSLLRFEPAERHALSTADGARILILLARGPVRAISTRARRTQPSAGATPSRRPPCRGGEVVPVGHAVDPRTSAGRRPPRSSSPTMILEAIGCS